jgi:GAF domain-containing protein
MVKDEDVIGMFNLGRTRMQPFTDKQIELITDFAAQAAIALEITGRERSIARSRTSSHTQIAC